MNVLAYASGYDSEPLQVSRSGSEVCFPCPKTDHWYNGQDQTDPTVASNADDSGFPSLQGGASEVQFQQVGQQVVVADIRVPAVGGEDGFVEFPVGQVEPRWAFVVEVGQRSLFELPSGGLVFGASRG